MFPDSGLDMLFLSLFVFNMEKGDFSGCLILPSYLSTFQVMLVWLCFVWSKAYLRGFEACDTALTVWGYVLYSAMILNFAKSTSCGQRAIGAMCWWDPDPAFPGRAPLRVKILQHA